jgi:hypothetical protein
VEGNAPRNGARIITMDKTGKKRYTNREEMPGKKRYTNREEML